MGEGGRHPGRAGTSWRTGKGQELTSGGHLLRERKLRLARTLRPRLPGHQDIRQEVDALASLLRTTHQPEVIELGHDLGDARRVDANHLRQLVARQAHLLTAEVEMIHADGEEIERHPRPLTMLPDRAD